MADASNKSATISAASTHTYGRFIIDARQNHFVADASTGREGPHEAPIATELFHASLATCALAVVTDAARKAEIRHAVYRVDVSSTPDDNDGTRFSQVAFAFHFSGVSKSAAERLVKEFTDICPIYNTVARTTPVDITIAVA